MPVMVLGCSWATCASWPGGNPGMTPDDPQHEALGAGHAEGGFHTLRRALQPVLERPEQAHEVEDRVQTDDQILVIGVGVAWLSLRTVILASKR